jgi:hydrogenase large subunit
VATLKKTIPLNRVEGDLELHLEFENDSVCEVRSVGTMYRGIENLMKGRGPMDSLVITPRICGICTTAHLNAAALALDMAYGTIIPDNAQRLRNVTLLVEQLQNDIRHTIMLFMPDLIAPLFSSQPLYDEALQRYQVLKGEACRQTVSETQKVLEIIAILGGQWPHSSFMVPGGVVSVPTASDITHCRHTLRNFRKWYERRILGCTIELFNRIGSWHDLMSWLVESPSHHAGELGFFLRYGLDMGLDKRGRGHDCFISYGGPELPESTEVAGHGGTDMLFPPGFYCPDGMVPLDPELIREDISSSFFLDDEATRHPYDGRTVPDHSDERQARYSWAKAPRYDGRPAETGPLADMLLAGRALFVEQVEAAGASVLLRELARLVRPALLLPAIDQWLEEMSTDDSPFYAGHTKLVTAKGYGLVPAPRGGLGHWVTIENGVIDNYQVITPTAWNASPRDAQGVRGPWEQAILGTRVRDPQNPVEVEQIVRSFDPCLVCTVHTIRVPGDRRHNALK